MPTFLLNLIPGFSAVKGWITLAIITAIITIAGLAFWHYNNVVGQLATEKAKNETLQNAINVQTQTINEAKDTIAAWQAAQKQLQDSIAAFQKSSDAAQQAVRRLSEIYAKHNLETLSVKQPSLIETRINAATARSLLVLKCASGSSDTNCGGLTKTGQDAGPTKPNGNTNTATSLGRHH